MAPYRSILHPLVHSYKAVSIGQLLTNHILDALTPHTMKYQILLNNYYLPGELQEHLRRFITYYNHERYHESLNNLTPANVYYGCGQEKLDQREAIKLNTLAMRGKMYYDNRFNLNLLGCSAS